MRWAFGEARLQKKGSKTTISSWLHHVLHKYTCIKQQAHCA
jgi:hypothetical protein